MIQKKQQNVIDKPDVYSKNSKYHVLITTVGYLQDYDLIEHIICEAFYYWMI